MAWARESFDVLRMSDRDRLTQTPVALNTKTKFHF
jgi:hypothetical protein